MANEAMVTQGRVDEAVECFHTLSEDEQTKMVCDLIRGLSDEARAKLKVVRP